MEKKTAFAIGMAVGFASGMLFSLYLLEREEKVNMRYVSNAVGYVC